MDKNPKELMAWWDELGQGWEGAAEDLKIRFAVEIERAMARQGVSKADLARRLATSPSYVTKLLSGETNCTIETMARAAYVLGEQLHLGIGAKGQPHFVVSVTGALASDEQTVSSGASGTVSAFRYHRTNRPAHGFGLAA